MKPRGVMMSVMLLAVSAAVAAAVSFAWFDLFRQSRAENLILRSEGQAVSVDGFKLFTSDEVESAFQNGNTLKLKSFDSVFGKNSETPVYILIPVGGDAVRAGSTLNFTFDCGGSALTGTVDGKDKILPYFSNVAQLRCVTVDEIPTDYSGAKAKFPELDDSSRCFASFTVDSNSHELQSGGEKTSSLTLSVSGYSAADLCYVLFELDYNDALVTGFVDNHTSDFSGRLDQTQNLEFNDAEHPEIITITVSAN
ncbi:MAG: hypothetical protein ACI4O3_00125 [Oscillospiraceae bacterium]